MRKLLTVFIIVLVVLVGGMTALVVLLNPNDFRGYLAQQVEKRSGYQLALNGDLRWHVWPQLSVIAGQMALTAPGAKKSFIRAENMRLDVELWPLLSHQLKVKQVILKGATINLTPESQLQNSKKFPSAPKKDASAEQTAQWQFGIDKVQLMDSLLVWEKENETQINVRNLNLDLVQNENKQVKISLSSQINKDQRDLTVSSKATLDFHQFPQKLNVDIEQLTYQLKGADLPINGIQGTMSVKATYDKPSEKLTVNPLNFSANKNHFVGNIEAILSKIPTYLISLSAKKIDLDQIVGGKTLKESNIKKQNASPVLVPVPAPVIDKNHEDLSQTLEALRDFNSDFLLKIDELSYEGIKIKNMHLALKNRQGQLSLSPLSGGIFEGHFLLTATADLTKKKTYVTLNPNFKDIALKPLLQSASLSPFVSGKASLKGTISGYNLTPQALMTEWKGNAKISMAPVQFNGLNLQQLIEQTVTKHMNVANVHKHYKPYTEIKTLGSDLTLNAGQLEINELKADSHLLSVKGKGALNLPTQHADIYLNVRLMQGFEGKVDWMKTLQNTEVPLRIYGPLTQLQYRIDVQSLFDKNLKEQVQKKLHHWLKKQFN